MSVPSQSVEFFFIGNPIQSTAERTEYEAFNLNGIEYRVGDCVYLYPEDEGPHYIAKVQAIFCDRSARADPHCVEVAWYERRLRLEPGLQGVHGTERELVELEETDVNPIGCISGKCCVLHTGSYEEANLIAQSVPGLEWFYCKSVSHSDALHLLDSSKATGKRCTGALEGPMDVEGMADSEELPKRQRLAEEHYSGTTRRTGKLVSGRTCVECGATQTPQWREGPAGPKTLCNACGVRHVRAQQRANKRAVALGLPRPAPHGRQGRGAKGAARAEAAGSRASSRAAGASAAAPSVPAVGCGGAGEDAVSQRPQRQAALLSANRTARYARTGVFPLSADEVEEQEMLMQQEQEHQQHQQSYVSPQPPAAAAAAAGLPPAPEFPAPLLPGTACSRRGSAATSAVGLPSADGEEGVALGVVVGAEEDCPPITLGYGPFDCGAVDGTSLPPYFHLAPPSPLPAAAAGMASPCGAAAGALRTHAPVVALAAAGDAMPGADILDPFSMAAADGYAFFPDGDFDRTAADAARTLSGDAAASSGGAGLLGPAPGSAAPSAAASAAEGDLPYMGVDELDADGFYGMGMAMGCGEDDMDSFGACCSRGLGAVDDGYGGLLAEVGVEVGVGLAAGLAVPAPAAAAAAVEDAHVHAARQGGCGEAAAADLAVLAAHASSHCPDLAASDTRELLGALPALAAAGAVPAGELEALVGLGRTAGRAATQAAAADAALQAVSQVLERHQEAARAAREAAVTRLGRLQDCISSLLPATAPGSAHASSSLLDMGSGCLIECGASPAAACGGMLSGGCSAGGAELLNLASSVVAVHS